MKYRIYFTLFCKRLFKKPSFLIILLLMPLFSACIMHFSTTEKSGLNVALYNAGSDGMSSRMEEYLLGLDGMIQFESCDSANEVHDRVKYRDSDCGYIFPADLTKRLAEGVSLGAIESVKSPGTTMISVANEFVIAAFLHTYSYDILENYTLHSKDTGHFSKEEIRSELFDYYSKYLFSDDTFSFTYKNASDELIDDINVIPDFLVHSVYGIGALFILIAALAGAIMAYKDEKDGVFSVFPPLQKAILQYMDILVPAFLCGIVAVINCFVLEGTSGILSELLRSAAFVFLCSGFCFFLKIWIPSPVVFSSSLPVLIIGSLLFCPVFLDLSAFIPRLTTVKYLFLPTYYLICKTLPSGLALLFGGIVLSALTLLLSYKTEKRI